MRRSDPRIEAKSNNIFYMSSGFSLHIIQCDDRVQEIVNNHKVEIGCHLGSFLLLTKENEQLVYLILKMLTPNTVREH